MTEDLAWAAGLFEGEGSISLSRGRPRIQIQMSDEDVVRRFHEAVGCGSVSGPSTSPSRHKYAANPKPIWTWQASGFVRKQDVQKTLLAMWPHLGSRRRARALELGATSPAKEHAA